MEMIQEQEGIKESGEVEAVTLLERRQKRVGEIKAEIHRLDAELEELNRGAAVVLADSEADDGLPEALRVRRHAIREELQDLHSGLGHLDTLIHEAEEDLREIRLDEISAKYLEAREAESQAVDKLARALKRLVPLLEAVHGAGQQSYALGLEAGLETSSRYYLRRRTAVEAHLGTVLGRVYPALAPPNRQRVDDLVEQLDAVLPATERVEEEVRGNGKAKA